MITLSLTLTYLELYFLVISLLSFSLYGYDKLQALTNRYRVSENILLFSSLLGGTLASIIAMLLFWHKVKKPSFLIKLSVVVIVQVSFLFLYMKGFFTF